MRTSAKIVGRAAMLVLLVAACAKRDPVELWLLCDDCAGSLDDVTRMGDDAVSPLDKALRQGPTAAARDNYRAQAAEEFRMRRRGTGSAVILTAADSTAFVNSALNNLVATFQKRAALALRTIGTPTARQALHAAALSSAQHGWSNDVLTLVLQLDSNDPITGVTVRSPVVDVPVGGNATMTAIVSGVGTVPQTVTWSVSNFAVGTVTTAGEFTRTGPGPVSVQACSTVKSTICGFTGLGPP
jgi:hypothetical protein